MCETPSSETPYLTLRSVSKRFGGVTALDDVDLELRRGEILALLGENGAGKSTLIKILAGIYRPDSGSIRIGDETVTIRDVADADRNGIRVIHQELSLAPNLSIAENIYLGREPRKWGLLDRQCMVRYATALIEELGLDEIRDVQTVVSRKSVAHRQLVEIARALSHKARILILDEPTSSLSEAETGALFATLRRLRSQGVGIIYISHRLEEITRLADRITVLRDGRSMGTQQAGRLDQRELVKWMIGRDLSSYFHRPKHAPGAPVLEVEGLHNEKVLGVDLCLHAGEILGVAGLVGSGRSELARAIFGIDPIHAGTIRVDGRQVHISGPGDALEAGIVLVPEDRRKEGLVMIQSLAFNIALPWTHDWNPGCMPDKRKRQEIVRRALQSFGIKAADEEQIVDSLSGGNQQKALVGRWMEHRPKVLILDEPTRGVDVGAREEMFAILRALVEEGLGVVLIASDLVEVMNMSHRIAIYRDGRILDTVPAEDTTMESVMQQLTGAELHANA